MYSIGSQLRATARLSNPTIKLWSNCNRLRAVGLTNPNITSMQYVASCLPVQRYSSSSSSSSSSNNSSCCHSGKKTQKAEPKLLDKAFWTDSLAWQRTRVNTLRCLLGCTTGDFAMMWYLQLNYPEVSPIVSTAAAMVAGLSSSLVLETVLLKRSMKVPVRKAFNTAMGMSFVSMLVMELAENVTDWHLMGGQVAFQDPKFWLAAAVSTAVGYIVPLPYNYWRLRALGKSCH
ncbi:hypothetical protein BDF20DRAFT_883782 [Mycotypha africana]|uniref:uncharacterized protein n=1 Tax=Mycotypha africana TaxID=64632 RepID=UPI002300CCFC|nr:uncharacterized protein BDF20DRAFT_883782 [Mycotypha africana]KAI8973719.1 hypothetical protein BDF20DRAFT_883782 [Mycotypha africana]